MSIKRVDISIALDNVGRKTTQVGLVGIEDIVDGDEQVTSTHKKLEVSSSVLAPYH